MEGEIINCNTATIVTVACIFLIWLTVFWLFSISSVARLRHSGGGSGQGATIKGVVGLRLFGGGPMPSVSGYCTIMAGLMVRYSVTALQCLEDSPHPRKINYTIYLYI